MNLETLKSQVKQQLPSKRYNHTLGVVATSEQLAKRYNASVESAQIADVYKRQLFISLAFLILIIFKK